MNHSQNLIDKVAKYVKDEMMGESSGHDWWHVYRVWKLSGQIAKHEKVDLLIVELSALLHDIADWKLGNQEASLKRIRELLISLKVDSDSLNKIMDIIENISFKGESNKNKISTLEGKVVQDADRLDAIGAIGIARVFAYGAHIGMEIHNPHLKPEPEKLKERRSLTGINHFYEKLLLLKEHMNTKTGKRMAKHRHKFLENYLQEFYSEWEGKK